jgi:uncharacterized delta-60 repeat protein
MRAPRTVRGIAVLVAALVVGIVFSAGAQAATGDLDLTFSGDGKQRTDFGLGFSRAAATVRQPDGKIVAVGVVQIGAAYDGDFALARYNPDGSLDTSFSGDGRQKTDFGGGFDFANGVALQENGKIVVVGDSNSGAETDFALARYNPNGSLDPSFSGDGRQTTNFGGTDQANGVALQANGKIVAGGRGLGDFALARYNPNGSLDPSFSGDGRQTTDFVGGFDQANGVALQAGGKIVAVGDSNSGAGTTGDFALARYNPNGSLDPSFSGDGRQRTNFGGTDQANGVALQAGGKIVAVGRGGAGAGDFALARYNPNGSLDPSFSGDGRQRTNFGGTDQANGVALQANGRIVAVGRGGAGAGDFTLARYNANGTLDPSFSGDGRQRTNFGGFDQANGVALPAGGKIVAVGRGGGDFALARYNPNGSLDPGFSGDGRQRTNFGGPDEANGVALQADGKIVAVGGSGGRDFALARYNPNGSLDPGLSGDGRQTTDFPGWDLATGVALQPDGKIVVVGSAAADESGSGVEDFALARYNADGSLDTSFSGDGRQTTEFGGFDRATGVALQPDGKIVAVGSGVDDFALARYNADGSLDTSFSGDGRQTTDFGGVGGGFDGAEGVALQADGKIVAVGRGADGGVAFALARYNADGSLDTSFSGDGQQTTDFSGVGGGFDEAYGVALQGDGKIVAVGGSIGIDSGFGLARYNPDGSLDTSFSGDGMQRTAIGDDAQANGVALQGDGKIVAAGAAGFDHFALARYNADGSLDTSFSGDGQLTTDVGGPANGVALQGDGKIVAAGYSFGAASDDFALARYNPDGSLDTSFSGDGQQTTNFGGFDRANGVVLQGDGKIVAVGSSVGADRTSDFALARYLGG